MATSSFERRTHSLTLHRTRAPVAVCSRHRLFNMFCPLVDLQKDGDGTMFWPGSHLARTRAAAYHAAIGRSARLDADPLAMAEMVVPACPAGGIILFDFRLHSTACQRFYNLEGDVLPLVLRSELTRNVAYYSQLPSVSERAEVPPPLHWLGGSMLRPTEPFSRSRLHRGMPNRSDRERAIAHAILSTGFATDRLSYPGTSLWTAVSSLSDDPKERLKQQDALAREQRAAWADVRASSSA